MALDKFAGLFASSAQSMASSARSIEHYAEMMESQMATQNALLTTLVDKLGNNGGGGGAGAKSKPDSKMGGLIAGLAADGTKAATGMAAFGEAAPEFAKGLKVLSKAMKFWEKVPEKTVDNFSESLNKLAMKFADMDFKSMAIGALAIREMSKSIAIFGLTLLVASAAYAIIGPMAMLTVIPVIAGFAYVFYKVGEAGESIERGAKSIGWMALGIVGMGLAMMMVKQLSGGSWGEFVKGSLIIVAGIAIFGLLFHMIGSMDNEIEDGAKSVAWMGLAIISLSIGLAVWQAFNIDFQTILYTAAGVALIGVAFGIIGIFDKYIEQGAIAMLWTGVAIGILAIGIGAFKLFGIGWDDLALTGAAVLGTGLLFAGAGFLGPFIALGAIAIMLAGAAMIVLSLGILTLNAAYKPAMSGLFGQSPTDKGKTNMSVMIDAIVDSFSINPIDSVFMLLGAVSLMFVSVAMITMSAGIWAMEMHADSSLWMDAKDSNGNKVTQLGKMIDSVVNAFSINPIDSVFMLLGGVSLMFVSLAMLTISAGIWAMGKHVDSLLFEDATFSYTSWLGGEKKEKTTKLGKMMGSIVYAFSINPIDSVFMMLGSVALLLASVAMITIAGGLWAIGKHADSDLFKTSAFDKDQTNMGVMFTSIVDSMAIGIFDLASLYMSIPAWLMVGASLMMIGSGVADFVKLYEKGIDPSILAEGLSTVLTGVVTAIISADSDTDWDSVEDGLDAISGVGDAISGIAEGVQAFAELKFPTYNEKGEVVKYLTLNDGVFKTVAANMKLLIGAVAGVLTEIGASQGETGWFSKTNGEKGADVIRGIGGDLSQIADFVEKAADLRMPMYDKDGKVIEGQTAEITPDMLGPGGKVARNIQAMIEAVSSALMKVGSKEAESEGWFSEGNITKGKEAIMGIGKDLKDIGDFVVAMSQTRDLKTTKFKIKQMLMSIPSIMTTVAPAFEKAKPSITKVISQLKRINEPLNEVLEFMGKAAKANVTEKTGQQLGKSIASLFTEIGNATDGDVLSTAKLQPVLTFVNKLSEKADPIKKLSDSFEKLANNMNKFVKAYKAMDKQSMDKHKMLIDSLVVFAKVDANALNAVSDRGKQLLDYINGGGPAEPTKSAPSNIEKSPEGGTKQKGTKPVSASSAKKAEPVKMDTSVMENTLAEIKSQLQQMNIKLGGTLKVYDTGS